MNENLGPLAPEIILAVSAVAGLLAGSWLPRDRQWLIRAMTAAACLAGLAAAALAATEPATTDFGTSYVIAVATSAVRIIVLAALLLIVCLSAGQVTAHPRETEFYVLLQLAALGTIVLAGAGDLLLLRCLSLRWIPTATSNQIEPTETDNASAFNDTAERVCNFAVIRVPAPSSISKRSPSISQNVMGCVRALPLVEAPTLLIVGGRDEVVITLNERARNAMRAEVRLEIVPGATHLFEERGALERARHLAIP